jgi:RND family efflux transporter MFP subunit
MLNLIKRFAGTFQLIFVVAVVGSAVLLSATLKPEASSGPPARKSDGVPVTVIEPVAARYRPSVELNGVVQARTVTDIIPQVSGRIIEVSSDFRPGGKVTKGDVLFRIEPSDYRLALERTAAEIEAARSDLALLEAQSAAERQIWNQQFSDRKIPDLIARVPQIAAAKARVRSGEAARETARLALQRTTVRAPFDARILQTRLDVGQVVSTAAAVGSLFSVDSLEIVVPVSADDLELIGPLQGRPASIHRGRAAGDELAGTVVRAAAALDERTRLGTLYVAAERNEGLVLGEFVTVRIDGQDTSNAFRLPAGALTSRDQVWVVRNGALEERRVDVIGNESGYAIVRAFDAADGVVAVPPSNLRNGLPVTVESQSRYAAVGGSVSGSR